jgi:MurNAc alpha-1-phosphate uridylyltransferase
MADVPKKAFVLAAGRGERMRPLTDNCPKPLLYVGGRTMLDRALDALEEAGVEEVVVNLYYLGGMIEEHLKTRKSPKITFSHEDELLDTGGGVKKALSFFGKEPFFVLNADVVWTDGVSGSTLKDMAATWDASKMDILLLLHTTQDLPAYNGKGDYYLPEGSLQPQFRERAGKPANFIFAGPRIVNPAIFAGAPEGAFSFLELFHKAEAAGRLYAHRHEGDWHHVGTPEALEETNRILAAQSKKRAP